MPLRDTVTCHGFGVRRDCSDAESARAVLRYARLDDYWNLFDEDLTDAARSVLCALADETADLLNETDRRVDVVNRANALANRQGSCTGVNVASTNRSGLPGSRQDETPCGSSSDEVIDFEPCRHARVRLRRGRLALSGGVIALTRVGTSSRVAFAGACRRRSRRRRECR